MLKKGRNPYIMASEGKKRITIKLSLQDIADAADVTYSAVKTASSRKLFDYKDLQSIAYYIVRVRKKRHLPEPE